MPHAIAGYHPSSGEQALLAFTIGGILGNLFSVSKDARFRSMYPGMEKMEEFTKYGDCNLKLTLCEQELNATKTPMGPESCPEKETIEVFWNTTFAKERMKTDAATNTETCKCEVHCPESPECHHTIAIYMVIVLIIIVGILVFMLRQVRRNGNRGDRSPVRNYTETVVEMPAPIGEMGTMATAVVVLALLLALNPNMTRAVSQNL